MKAAFLFLFLHPVLSSEEEGEEYSNIEYVMFFIIYGIVISILVSGIKHFTGIPYTPMLLIVGILMGVTSPWLWAFGSSVQFVITLTGQFLLYVFIPPLIFESAFSFDVIVFNNAFFQILILAVPVVAMQAIFTAGIILYVLGYSGMLSWSQGLVIGSILSATDPVAVVSILKELGTPISFNILLEGESLLNDGTGTVFFQVFYHWMLSGDFTAKEFTIKFSRLALGGPLIGILIGLLTYPLLKRIINYESFFVVCSVIVVYFTYFVAESEFFRLHSSGILAVVALGIFFSYKLKNRVVGSLELSMHAVWGFLSFVIESLLFILTGSYLGVFFIKRDHSGLRPNILDVGVIWQLLIFQVLLFLLRGLILVLFWFPINKSGKKQLNWKDILVMTYAGLRGAIGLSLALVVRDTTAPSYMSIESFQLFQIVTILLLCFTIVFTVLVFGLTIKGMLMKIKFIPEGILFSKIKILAEQKLIEKSLRKIEKLKLDQKYYDKVIIEDVMKILNLTESKLTKLEEKKSRKKLQFQEIFKRMDLIIKAMDDLIREKQGKLIISEISINIDTDEEINEVTHPGNRLFKSEIQIEGNKRMK